MITDIIHGQFYLNDAYASLNRQMSTTIMPADRIGWRSHASVFVATTSQPNITITVSPVGSPQWFSVEEITLIELCDGRIMWPPTETCDFDTTASGELLLNGNFGLYDARYPSVISHWDVDLPGRTDNALILPKGGDPEGDTSNTAAIGLTGLNPAISQIIYGLDVAKEYVFSFSVSKLAGLSTNGDCELFASLDDDTFWRATNINSRVSPFLVVTTSVFPSAPIQTLRFGIRCDRNTGFTYKEHDRFTQQYGAFDDFSFRALDRV